MKTKSWEKDLGEKFGHSCPSVSDLPCASTVGLECDCYLKELKQFIKSILRQQQAFFKNKIRDNDLAFHETLQLAWENAKKQDHKWFKKGWDAKEKDVKKTLIQQRKKLVKEAIRIVEENRGEDGESLACQLKALSILKGNKK